MKQKGIGLSFVFLVSILVVPLGYSNAEMENQTNSTIPVNATASVQDNIGQQISDFVHQATDQFKQQKNETLNAIKDCREKIKNATPEMKSQVADDCHKNLQSITIKYKDERQQFQELFKRFRENIKTLRQEANDTSSNNDKDMAIKHIDEDVAKNGLGGLENALAHMKGMGLQHGKRGVENAMGEVNKTRGMEGMSSSNSSLSQNTHGLASSNGDHEGDDKDASREGKGKK
jgi:predicted RND superfamily exporter protein